jgi:hypothetical protein
MTRISEWIYLILSVLTAMVGYHIHGSVFWAIMDFIFMPFVWCKWLVLHQVNISIIKHTFMFFMQ